MDENARASLRGIIDRIRANSAKTTFTQETIREEFPSAVEEENEEAQVAVELKHFQVVRREFFANLQEPTISFADYKIGINAACISKFPEFDYVEILVNSETKKLVLLPCDEFARDGIRWCNDSDGKRKPRQITCKIFYEQLRELLNWNLTDRYKYIGRVGQANGVKLLIFDLYSPKVFAQIEEDGKKKRSTTASYRADWKNQFGMSFEDHQQYKQLNLFEGYTLINLQEQPAQVENANGDANG